MNETTATPYRVDELEDNICHCQVIFGDEEELSDWVYFILNGKCWLIEQMSMVRSKSPYKRSCLTLSSLADKKLKHFLDKPYGKRFRQLTTDTHCLTITTLRKGDYFGVGKYLPRQQEGVAGDGI